FIPVLQTIRVIMRAGVLLAFGVSALVAIGAEAMLTAEAAAFKKCEGYWRWLSIAALILVAVGVVASYVLRLSGFESGGGHGRLAFIRNAASLLSAQFTPPAADVLTPLGLMLIIGFFLWLTIRGRIGRSALYWSLVALLLCDLFWNSRGLNPTFDRSNVYPHTQVTDFIRQLPPGRVLVTPSDLDLNVRSGSERDKIIAPPNTLLAYGIPVIAGKDQLFPKSYKEFCALAEPQQNLSHVVFDISSSPYFDMLGARYVLTHDYCAPPKDSKLLLKAQGLCLYENSHAMPRAFFASEIVRCGAEADVLSELRQIGSPGMAVLTGSPGADVVQPGRVTGFTGTANIIEDKRNQVKIATDATQSGLLVLSDNYYPGWRADIDGTAVPIIRANHTMRAVAVPAGHHVVSFGFEPAILKFAIGIVIGTAIVILIGLSFMRLRRRKHR
ncbi:MAG TPA: YfhO family protein, partial [Blastocatellia bacterium]